MLKQTLHDFAWLVYTDPELEPVILQELKELLQPHPNFYLVLSNDNEQSVPQLVEMAEKNSLNDSNGQSRLPGTQRTVTGAITSFRSVVY